MGSAESRPRALVTGVAHGIGRAVATRLLVNGWEVVGVYNSSGEAARELAAAGSGLELVRANLASTAEVDELIESVGPNPLRALINNAGMIEFEDVEKFDPGGWARTFAVNAQAPVHLVMGLADRLSEGSSVVNIASTDALRGSYNSMAYAASKAALLNATQSLANLFGPRGIRVNAVTPGWIDTGMVGLAPEEPPRLTPLGRLGTPEEVAACVAWLLSDESAFVSGASLVVDGGLLNVDPILLAEAEAGGG